MNLDEHFRTVSADWFLDDVDEGVTKPADYFGMRILAHVCVFNRALEEFFDPTVVRLSSVRGSIQTTAESSAMLRQCRICGVILSPTYEDEPLRHFHSCHLPLLQSIGMPQHLGAHPVWRYFRQLGEDLIACLECGQQLKQKTGNATNHLRKCHPRLSAAVNAERQLQQDIRQPKLPKPKQLSVRQQLDAKKVQQQSQQKQQQAFPPPQLPPLSYPARVFFPTQNSWVDEMYSRAVAPPGSSNAQKPIYVQTFASE